MTISDNVHRLTRPHLTSANGKPATVPSLLDQLAAAIHPSAAGGASGGSPLRIPIDTGAMSLWQDIEREARAHHVELTGSPGGPLMPLLQSWPDYPMAADWTEYLEHATLDWIDRITALLQPAKPYRPSQACPSCDQRFHGDDNTPTLAVYWRDEDGNTKHPHDWRMECGHCGATWQGKELGHIAHAIKEAA